MRFGFLLVPTCVNILRTAESPNDAPCSVYAVADDGLRSPVEYADACGYFSGTNVKAAFDVRLVDVPWRNGPTVLAPAGQPDDQDFLACLHSVVLYDEAQQAKRLTKAAQRTADANTRTFHLKVAAQVALAFEAAMLGTVLGVTYKRSKRVAVKPAGNASLFVDPSKTPASRLATETRDQIYGLLDQQSLKHLSQTCRFHRHVDYALGTALTSQHPDVPSNAPIIYSALLTQYEWIRFDGASCLSSSKLQPGCAVYSIATGILSGITLARMTADHFDTPGTHEWEGTVIAMGLVFGLLGSLAGALALIPFDYLRPPRLHELPKAWPPLVYLPKNARSAHEVLAHDTSVRDLQRVLVKSLPDPGGKGLIQATEEHYSLRKKEWMVAGTLRQYLHIPLPKEHNRAWSAAQVEGHLASGLRWDYVYHHEKGWAPFDRW